MEVEGVEKIFDYLMEKDAGIGIAPFFIFFVASYVLGFGLRSFHPDMSEGIYRFFHLEKYKVWKYLVNIRLCKRGRLRIENKFSRIFKKTSFSSKISIRMVDGFASITYLIKRNLTVASTGVFSLVNLGAS
uniref:Uncharacterized protein n=1 Tax=Candidatus Kentrum sp. LFY TaxID=2126342 RepID=A0A450UY05_9GAMM|nr:MAG: hypothetical protein BECKLFY1418B_GA0070995_11012 [Candidatus Kentron sp. LFY]